MTKAMIPFSADPIHYGHMDIIKTTASLFDEVVAAIGVNPDKKYMFTLEERTDMAQKALSDIPNVELVAYEGLTVHYAYENNIPVIVKGIRNSRDSDYEQLLDTVNKSQKLGIETMALYAKRKLDHISSSTAKAVQKEHGDVLGYAPIHIKQALERGVSGQYILGITGEIGSGKSYTSKKFEELGKRKGIEVHNIELDHIAHEILSIRKEPRYELVREETAEKFGEHLMLEDGTINRKSLGDIVFKDYDKLQELNEIMGTPILVRYKKELNKRKGIILVNAALIAESNLGYLCNNNVVLMDVDAETQERRLRKRDRHLTDEQISRRILSQYNFAVKKQELEKAIEKDGYGKIWILGSSDDSDDTEAEQTFDSIVKVLKVKKTNEP